MKVIVALLMLLALPARADTPISKCWSKVCAEPQVSVSLVSYRITAPRKISAGLLPVGSVGYGLRTVGGYLAAGLFLSASVGGGTENYVAPSVIVRVMKAFSAGIMCRAGEDSFQWSILIGGGFGL